MTQALRTFVARRVAQTLCFGLLTAGAGLSGAAALSQAQYDTLLAAGLKAVALPCKYPNVVEPKTREAAEALAKAGNEFGACLKEHDVRRQRYYDMAEVSDKAMAAKLSQPQIDAYRAALKAFIQEDVDKNRRMIGTTFSDVRMALQAYVIKSKPDAPAGVYDALVGRLAKYEYTCEIPAVPRYIDSRSEARAFNAAMDRVYDCDDAWLTDAKALTARGLEAVVSEAELQSLSYAQGKALHDKVIETAVGIQARYKQRTVDFEAFSAAIGRLRERNDERQAAREAEERDIAEIKATGAAWRKAIQDAGNAATGNTGRYVPLQLPKRPGQP